MVGPFTGAVGDEMEKVRSNSRRAKAASVHSAAVGAGARGAAVLAANGLMTALTTLGTVGGVVAVGVCPATTSTPLASTPLVGFVVSTGGAFGAAGVRVAFAAGGPGSADAVVRRADAVLVVIVDPPTDSLGPTRVSGAGALERLFVAVLLAGAVVSVESGSDLLAPVVRAVPADRKEPVGESVCAPPVDDESDGELVLEPVGSADATAGVLAMAVPTPSATANAPTRPMYFALLIVGPPSISRRNDGDHVGSGPAMEIVARSTRCELSSAPLQLRPVWHGTT